MLGGDLDAAVPPEPRQLVNGVIAKDPVMLLTSVDFLIDALRELKLLRKEQLDRVVNEFASQFEQTADLAKHLVKLGWITRYQAKKLLAGHGSDLILGHYVIFDKLGEGGMGKVYKAKQLHLNRVVALKMIRPDLIANEMALKRFQREAKAAAQLAHPNIVRLFDADRVGNRHFLAMEFIEGTDLAALVKESGPLPIGMACSFIRQAATGLQHAHDLGLIHRDIKPSNLLVTSLKKGSKTGAGGVIKILDMGLARAAGLQESDSAESALTQDGAVIGTPDFMSPEQAKNSSIVDARSDLYSLGCTFYYLLTGQAPFPTGNTLEKLLQHQMDPPPHVQLRRDDLPNEVAAIVHTLLAKRPEERFQKGAALAQALEPWSVFDGRNARLKSVDAPTEAVPAALPLSGATARVDATTEGEPFNFDIVESNTPVPTRSEPARAQRPKSNKSLWWIVGAAASLALLIAAILIGRSFANKDEAGKPAQDEQANKDNVDPRPLAKKGQPIARREMEPIDAYLPADSEMVAILNVQQLAKSKYFQTNLLKELARPLESLRKATSFDPLTAVERVVVALPSGDWDHPVIVVQGPEALPQEFTNWVASQEGVKLKDELVRGVGLHRIYIFPDKEKDEPTYGAILQVSPFSVVLSTNKDRVIEAIGRTLRRTDVRFEDPSVRAALGKYPAKAPPALWVGLGIETKIFGFIGKGKSPKDGAIHALYATLRLGDNLEFDAFIEADNRFRAEFFWQRLNYFFTTLADNKKDPRIERIAGLFTGAHQVPRAKLNTSSVHQWTNFVSADKLDEWFEPFMSAR